MAVLPLTHEELLKLRLYEGGKKHPVRIIIETMPIGETISITREDFTWKRRTPRYFINQIERLTKKRYRMLTKYGKGGWVVQRLDDAE